MRTVKFCIIFPEQPRWRRQSATGSIDYRQLIHLMKMEVGLAATLEQLKGMVHLAVCTNGQARWMQCLRVQSGYFSFVMTAARASFRNRTPIR
jgi:FMN phosphatase YigB (HAD superfamily)